MVEIYEDGNDEQLSKDPPQLVGNCLGNLRTLDKGCGEGFFDLDVKDVSKARKVRGMGWECLLYRDAESLDRPTLRRRRVRILHFSVL